MTREQIQKEVETALAALEPSEVRIHFEEEDCLLILILSEKFKDMGVFTRIQRCFELFRSCAKEIEENYLLILEPVTVEEFKTRSSPWPE